MATNEWIDPPNRPDLDEVERLGAACRQESRIAELWVTGSRFTRDDGSSSDSTDIALVLDPAIADRPDETEVATMADRTGHLAVARSLSKPGSTTPE